MRRTHALAKPQERRSPLLLLKLLMLFIVCVEGNIKVMHGRLFVPQLRQARTRKNINIHVIIDFISPER